jgi:integral membrane protein
MTPRTAFRIASIAEAITWTALIAAMVARYAFSAEVPFFFAIGLAHGVVFIAFVAACVVVGMNQRWKWWVIVVAAATAIPPYGTLVTDVVLERRGLLHGGWRLEAGDDPRDRRPLDRLLRWFLNRPWLFLVVLVAVVALLTVVALVAGPPVG